MDDTPLNLAVIVGSTRDGRFGRTIVDWFVSRAAERDDFVVDLIDLAELDLPAVMSRQAHPSLDAYRRRLDAADAFVVVTPEYNHGYPAPLKHAIDFANREWKAKPLGFVSYGGLSAGLRAVEQLRQVFAELHVATMRDTVSFPMYFQLFDGDGQPKEAEGANGAVTVMLNQLHWWGSALRTARIAGPPA